MITEEVEDRFLQEYHAQCLWLLLHAHYKKPPIDSYLSIKDALHRPQDSRSAEDIKADLLTKLKEK